MARLARWVFQQDRPEPGRVSIGYSMPQYDTLIIELFRLAAILNPGLCFHIVDPDDGALARFRFLPGKRCSWHRATLGDFVADLDTR